jgi:hypothetical protein
MKNTLPRSPRITHISWGHIEVEGVGTGKDFKLYPGGGREWDWNETGTRHDTGIQPDDVEELVSNGASILVVGCGMNQRLRVSPETIRFLEECGVILHVRETKEAVELYNRLAETQAVGGLIHSTC